MAAVLCCCTIDILHGSLCSQAQASTSTQRQALNTRCFNTIHIYRHTHNATAQPSSTDAVLLQHTADVLNCRAGKNHGNAASNNTRNIGHATVKSSEQAVCSAALTHVPVDTPLQAANCCSPENASSMRQGTGTPVSLATCNSVADDAC